MIIKASQRGGGRKLAAHLMNERDNEHVELHECPPSAPMAQI